MDITLKINDSELDKLLKLTQEDPEMQNIYWQLRGQWLVGGNDEIGFMADN